MKGQHIIDKVRLVLDDASGTGWSVAELVEWINSACLFVALLRPDSCAVNTTMTLAAGPRQSIAQFAGLRLLDVVYNSTTGRAMRMFERRRMDAVAPNWYGSAQGAPTDYAFDNRDPATFYVSPPSLAGQKLNVVYSRTPVKISVGEVDTVDLTPPDIYIEPIVNYVLFRAKSKEVEHAADQAAAGSYLQLARSLLGDKGGSDKAFSPVQNTPSATPTPAGL